MALDPQVLCDDLCEQLAAGAGGAAQVSPRLLQAAAAGALPAVFSALIAAGRYDALCAALASEPDDSPVLRALCTARPDFDLARLNGPATAAAQALRARRPETPYDLLIVPGFTPVDATEPTPIERVPAAGKRLERAYRDYQAGLAPFILLTGGAVHPPGTPHNEGLMMREQLLAAGLPEAALFVDPYARHSTTNLRNAGRLMRALDLPRGLIVTGFDRGVFSQAFYFSHPTLSTFHARCRDELGYSVGELEAVDDYHAAFRPSAEVHRPNLRDPLDY